MTRRSIISALCCLSVLLAGCIKEEFDNCFDEVSYALYFVYEGNGTTNIFDKKTESVDVYIFDADGGYFDYKRRTKQELNIFRGIVLDLDPGEYQIVCWSNTTELSRVTYILDEQESYRLSSTPYLEGRTVTDFDSLYCGIRSITVPENISGSDTVYFGSAHIDVEVYIEGLSTTEAALRAAGDPQGRLEVRNVFAAYDFFGRVTGQTVTAEPPLIREGDILTARFRLFRFDNDTDIAIDVYNGRGTLVYSLGMSRFLADNDISVEGVNEITIPVRIRFEGMNVHVSVDGWGSEDVDPIL